MNDVGSYAGVVYIVEVGPMDLKPAHPGFASVLASGAGNSPPPPPSPTGSTTPSPPPAIGTATGTVTVMWNANTEADLAGYRVYVGTASGVRSPGVRRRQCHVNTADPAVGIDLFFS